MPYLTGSAVDPQALPVVTQVQLTADVAIAPVNTSTDLLTFGTIQPGLYLVSAQIDIAQVTNVSVITLQFLLGGAIVKAAELLTAIGAGYVTVPPFPLSVGVAAVLKLVGFTTVVTTTAKKVATNNGVGTDNLVSSITAVRIA